MLKKKSFLQPLTITFFLLIIASCSTAQETPSENDSNTPIIENIDTEENLLDSNQAYKKQFDSLSKDGEWIRANKADFIKDITEETGEDLGSYYPATSEVIYIWRPYCANVSWNPYYNGRWVFSSYGWIWMSDYDWGWGPYNYGRWHFSNYYGWVWLPGRVWACNWVTWRHHYNYVGWYPTCPRIYWSHYNNFYSNKKYAYVPIHWIFLKKKDFTAKVDNTTIVKADQNAEILKNSVKVKSVMYDVDPTQPKFKYTGPDVNEISKETGEKITPQIVDVKSFQDKQNDEGKNVSVYKGDGSSKEVNDGSSAIKPDNEGGTNSTKNSGNYDTKTSKSGTVKNKRTQKESPGSNDGWKTNKGTKESNPGSSNDRPKESTPEKNNEGTKGNTNDKKSDGNKGIFKTNPK